MVAVTYIGITSADSLFRWMAQRQEEKIDHIKFDRQAIRLRRELMKELEEKGAATS